VFPLSTKQENTTKNKELFI